MAATVPDHVRILDHLRYLSSKSVSTGERQAGDHWLDSGESAVLRVPYLAGPTFAEHFGKTTADRRISTLKSNWIADKYHSPIQLVLKKDAKTKTPILEKLETDSTSTPKVIQLG